MSVCLFVRLLEMVWENVNYSSSIQDKLLKFLVNNPLMNKHLFYNYLVVHLSVGYALKVI